MGSLSAAHDISPALAAFALARRITGSEASALACVEAAAAQGNDLVRGAIVEARRRRGTHRPPAVPRPAGLSEVRSDDWLVVERVVLGGATLGEAAAELGLAPAAAAVRLRDGLRAVRAGLSVGRQAHEEAHAAAVDGLGADRPGHALHDPPRDREPQAAARPLIAF